MPPSRGDGSPPTGPREGSRPCRMSFSSPTAPTHRCSIRHTTYTFNCDDRCRGGRRSRVGDATAAGADRRSRPGGGLAPPSPGSSCGPRRSPAPSSASVSGSAVALKAECLQVDGLVQAARRPQPRRGPRRGRRAAGWSPRARATTRARSRRPRACAAWAATSSCRVTRPSRRCWPPRRSARACGWRGPRSTTRSSRPCASRSRPGPPSFIPSTTST